MVVSDKVSESVECHPNPNFSVSSPLLHAHPYPLVVTPSLVTCMDWVKTGARWADCWKIHMTSLANFTGFPTLALVLPDKLQVLFQTCLETLVLPSHIWSSQICPRLPLWMELTLLELGCSHEQVTLKNSVSKKGIWLVVPCLAMSHSFLSWGHVLSLEMT